MKTSKWHRRGDKLIVEIGRLLALRGFGEAQLVVGEVETDPQCVEWRKPMFQGYEAMLSISSGVALKRPGTFSMSAHLFVMSGRQSQVERETAMLDCFGSFNPVGSSVGAQDRDSSVPVLVASLNWLMGGMEPPIGTFSETLLRWADVRAEDFGACAVDVVAMYDRFGVPFFGWVDSPSKLASVILDPDVLPVSRKGSRPGSAAPSVYGSVLLADAGEYDSALAAMDRDERILEARVERGDAYPQALSVLRCKHQKLREWMAERMV